MLYVRIWETFNKYLVIFKTFISVKLVLSSELCSFIASHIVFNTLVVISCWPKREF